MIIPFQVVHLNHGHSTECDNPSPFLPPLPSVAQYTECYK